MNTLRCAVLCCAWLGMHAVAAAQEPLTLVKAGRPVSVIVTNGRPSETLKLAAAEMQEHLKLMSGATVPVIMDTEPVPGTAKVLILVGPSNLTKKLRIDPGRLEPEGFIIRTTGNAIVLWGDDSGGKSNSRQGTLWAVYGLLQDQFGCRWIWPGDIGRVVPPRATVTVPQLDVRQSPAVRVRAIRMALQDKHREGYAQEGLGKILDLGAVYDQLATDERDWLRRMRMGKSINLSYGHAFTDWWKALGTTDPEIFALLPDGRRGPAKLKKPEFVKMCVSNPDLWERQLAPLKVNAQKGAKGLWLNACENDGSAGFCTCDKCRAWDAGRSAAAKKPAVQDGSDVDGGAGSDPSGLPDSLSDRYAHWYNELAQRARKIDPESRVIAYAYSRYRAPPQTIERLEPNLWIGYVGFNNYPRGEEYRQMSCDEWSGWSGRGATVFLRSNSLFYFGEGAPCVATRQFAEDTKFQFRHGMQATDYDCLQGYWAASGPTYYVLARLLWAPETDIGQLEDEFYSAFGPASAAVREYFDYWEDFTTRAGNDPRFASLNRTERMQAYPRLYTPAAFARARTILDKARRALPQASEQERERFKNIELGLEHGRLLVQALQDGRVSNGAEGRELLEFRRKIAPRNVLNVYWETSKEKRYRVWE